MVALGFIGVLDPTVDPAATTPCLREMFMVVDELENTIKLAQEEVKELVSSGLG